MKKNNGAFKMISPIVVWMLAFFVVPIFFIVIISFFTRGQYGEIKYSLSLNNYARLINLLYIKILVQSLVIAVATTILCLIFGYPFAYFIAKSSKKYRMFLLLLVIIPFWTNSLVRTYAWIILLRSEGIINSYLIKFNIIKEPLTLLYNNTAVLIGMVYMMFPFMVLPLYASIEKLDVSYLEAAADLGASKVSTFLKVTLPLTMPGIAAGCVLVFVPALGYFFISDLMGGSKIMLISNLIKNQFLTARDWPFGSAVSMALMLIMFIVIGFYSKFNRKKEEAQKR